MEFIQNNIEKMCTHITGKMLLSNNISELYSGDNINLIVEIETQEKIFIKGKICLQYKFFLKTF